MKTMTNKSGYKILGAATLDSVRATRCLLRRGVVGSFLTPVGFSPLFFSF